MADPFDFITATAESRSPFAESYEEGKRDEEVVKDFFTGLGFQTRWATADEDRIGKCDFFWRDSDPKEHWSGVDVKGLKRGGIVVEHQGITGHPGWLQGKANHIAFRTSKSAITLVNRKAFADFVYSRLGHPTMPVPKGRNSSMPFETWFSRYTRDDVIAKLRPEFFEEFKQHAIREGRKTWIIKLS